MCSKLFILFILLNVYITSGLRSSTYLQSTVNDLNNRLSDGSTTKRRIDSMRPKVTKQSTRKGGPGNVPSLTLTKGELAALYEAALAKEHAQKGHEHKSPIFDHSSSSYAIDKPHNSLPEHTNTEDGYYYYYYPLESFMDGHSHHHDEHHDPTHPPDSHLAQYHSHTHQHNVHITSTKNPLDSDKKKHMEPLFMAVSSFIGMAVMFVLSIIFLPKFGVLKSRGSTAGEVTGLTDLVFRAIHGDNCSERLACELGKRAKPLKMHNNRFIKLLKRMSPASVGWYVDGMNKYSRTNVTCASIQCIPKHATKQKPTVKK